MSAFTPDKNHTDTPAGWEALKALDRFGSWLGIRSLETKPGYSKLQMTIREEMLNPMGITHGGILFSLADTALGYACNAGGQRAVALEASISFIKASHAGDILTAETKQVHDGKATGLYIITVSNQHNETVALFKGTCFNISGAK
ncbi:MAG: hydroxyphenylacetyl-CoA thioesterase PaaI [Chitinophagaceae bacterium]|nr:hydroxyphenylacetyl-CoA thioesterase PaaI [Chitinophagaceae bacterium]